MMAEALLWNDESTVSDLNVESVPGYVGAPDAKVIYHLLEKGHEFPVPVIFNISCDRLKQG